MDIRNTQEIEKEKIINKFILLSEKYHKLSLLFYELSQSIKVHSHNKSLKETREYIKTLDLDINKIKILSKGITDLSLSNIQMKGGIKE